MSVSNGHVIGFQTEPPCCQLANAGCRRTKPVEVAFLESVIYRWIALSGLRITLVVVMASCLSEHSAAQHYHVINGTFPATVHNDIGTSWMLSGTVRNELGLPVPNSLIALRYANDESTSSDTLGRFSIAVNEKCRPIVQAPGYAPQYLTDVDRSQCNVVLKRGRTISGKIYGLDGMPAEGVTVTPFCWTVPWPKELQFAHGKSDFVDFLKQAKSRAVKTNKDGRFSIPHMPSEHRVGLTIKKQGARTTTVYVRPDKDPRLEKDKKNQRLLDNDFEYDLNPPYATVLIKAFDEQGNPANIRRVRVQPCGEADDGDPTFIQLLDQYQEKPRATVTISTFESWNYTAYFIEPEDWDQLLGALIRLPKFQPNEHVEKEVVFKKGVSVTGKVVEKQSQQPIEGVRIKWHLPSKNYALQHQGSFPNMDLVTDQDGKFNMVVPETQCVVYAPGAEGYLWGPLPENVDFFKDRLPDIYQNHLQKLDYRDLEAPQPIVFQLEKALDAKITCVDESNHPVPDAVVTVDCMRETSISASGYVGSARRKSYSIWQSKWPRSAVADESGFAKVDYVFSSSLGKWFAKKHRESAGKQYRNEQFTKTPWLDDPVQIAVKVQAFSPNGLKQFQGWLHIPESSNENTISATLTLKTGENCFGKIVDQKGDPVDEAVVRAKLLFDNRHGQVWETKTRKDGWFKLAGLPKGIKLNWTVNKEGIASIYSERRRLNNTLIDPEEPIITDPIKVFNLSRSIESIPKLSLDGVGDKHAIKAFLNHLETISSLIPFSNSIMEGREAIKFGEHISKRLRPLVTDVLGRNAGLKSDTQILEATLEVFDRCFQIKIKESAEGKAILVQFLEHFAKEHGELPGAGKWIRRLVDARGNNQGVLRPRVIRQCLKHRFCDETKLWLCQQLLAEITNRMSYRSLTNRLVKYQPWLDELDSILSQIGPKLSKTSTTSSPKAAEQMRNHFQALLQLSRPSRTSMPVTQLAKQRMSQLADLLQRHQKLIDKFVN